MRERRKVGERKKKKLRMEGVAFFRNAQPNAHRFPCQRGLNEQ